MESFLNIGIIGVILSAVVELVKYLFPTEHGKAIQVVAIVGSILLGIAYHFFADTQIFSTILAILATATVVYEYVIKKFTN